MKLIIFFKRNRYTPSKTAPQLRDWLKIKYRLVRTDPTSKESMKEIIRNNNAEINLEERRFPLIVHGDESLGKAIAPN